MVRHFTPQDGNKTTADPEVLQNNTLGVIMEAKMLNFHKKRAGYLDKFITFASTKILNFPYLAIDCKTAAFLRWSKASSSSERSGVRVRTKSETRLSPVSL